MAPKGNSIHRIWRGGCLKALRDQHADEQDVRTAAECDIYGRAAWERALITRPPLPLKRPSPDDTFHWHVRPKELPVKGDVYPDGSLLDGIVPELARTGWACVVMDEDGEVIAAAYGVPPPWCKGIEGAEAWALYQGVGMTSTVESRYWPDCLPVKIAMSKGPEVAKDPKNMLARVHSMLHCALDDDEARKRVGWMPSHLEDTELGLARRSDGNLVTKKDLLGNQLADLLAKQGVEFHRVGAADVKTWKDQLLKAEGRAKWVGIATHEANNFDHFPYKDSEAARWRAETAKRAKFEARKGIDGRRRRNEKKVLPELLPHEGGHDLWKVSSGKGWFCMKCKARTACRKK